MSIAAGLGLLKNECTGFPAVARFGFLFIVVMLVTAGSSSSSICIASPPFPILSALNVPCTLFLPFREGINDDCEPVCECLTTDTSSSSSVTVKSTSSCILD